MTIEGILFLAGFGGFAICFLSNVVFAMEVLPFEPEAETQAVTDQPPVSFNNVVPITPLSKDDIKALNHAKQVFKDAS